MNKLRALAVLLCTMGLPLVANAADTAPKRVAPAEAKGHIGEAAVVCGNVVDAKTFQNSVSGVGTPIYFDLDQPEPTPIFYFVVFGPQVASKQQAEMKKAIETYKGKNVCVTGKIMAAPDGTPFIMTKDKSSIKTDPGQK